MDGFGRVVSDLRVSLTDVCNLRCTYCMPAEGLPCMPASQRLTDDELVRAASVFVSAGISQIRLTGGEPLLRPRLPGLVARLAALEPRPRLAMTTNGLSLARWAGPLASAGLDRVNVSLDTIDPQQYCRLTGRDRLRHVIAGLAAAREAGLRPVKVNAVVMRGVNEGIVPDLLAWCLERGYELRFIEQMPLDAQHGWRRDQMVTGAEIRELLARRFTLRPAPGERGSSPAQHFTVDGGPGTVGLVSSVTAPFCGACDRIRLTADGMVRSCLFARRELDLRTPLRGGAGPGELLDLIREELWHKPRAHGINEAGFTQPVRPMSSIGG